MKDSVCKFNDSIANAVNCTQFVYETSDIQKNTVKNTVHCLGIVVKGAGSITVQQRNETLSAGDVYVIRKNTEFSIQRGADMEYSYISFHGWRADELMERIGASRHSLVFHGHEALLPFWLSCFSKAERGNLDLFSESVLLYVMAHLTELPKEKNDLSEKITEYINERFSNPTLSISEIAKELGYDPKYLSAVFKSKKGVTFTEYLRTLRVKHAAFLFEEGIESVKSVAVLSGFSDALYFSKRFKAETGMTPSEYIQKTNKST